MKVSIPNIPARRNPIEYPRNPLAMGAAFQMDEKPISKFHKTNLCSLYKSTFERQPMLFPPGKWPLEQNVALPPTNQPAHSGGICVSMWKSRVILPTLLPALLIGTLACPSSRSSIPCTDDQSCPDGLFCGTAGICVHVVGSNGGENPEDGGSPDAGETPPADAGFPPDGGGPDDSGPQADSGMAADAGESGEGGERDAALSFGGGDAGIFQDAATPEPDGGATSLDSGSPQPFEGGVIQIDAGLDAGLDSGTDAGPEPGFDARTDAGSAVGMDGGAGVDSGAAPDDGVPSDAGPQSDSGAAPDAGDCDLQISADTLNISETGTGALFTVVPPSPVSSSITLSVTTAGDTAVVENVPSWAMGDDSPKQFGVKGGQDFENDGDEAVQVNVTVTGGQACLLGKTYQFSLTNLAADKVLRLSTNTTWGDFGGVGGGDSICSGFGDYQVFLYGGGQRVPGGSSWVMLPFTAYYRSDGTYLTTTDANGRPPTNGASWTAGLENTVPFWSGFNSALTAAGTLCGGAFNDSGAIGTSGAGNSGYSALTNYMGGYTTGCQEDFYLLCVEQ
jgi:hypothetical protein